MTEQQRANELAKIINDASKGLTAEEIFENGVSIKTKVSKSDWYNSQEGSGHERSVYETYVLKSVHDDAKELQAIRKANQDNFQFDFKACSYTHVVYRMADHDNYAHSALDLELVLNSAEQEAKEAQEWARYDAQIKANCMLNIGDRVNHDNFGLGTIIMVEGSDDETVFTIDFDKVGTHRLMALAPIRKAEN